MTEQLPTNQVVYSYLSGTAERSYRWAKEHGYKHGDAYVLACQCDELVKQIERLKAQCCRDGACHKCHTGPVTTLTDEQRYEAHVEMERQAHAQTAE